MIEGRRAGAAWALVAALGAGGCDRAAAPAGPSTSAPLVSASTAPPAPVCEPGQTRCQGGTSELRCAAGGAAWEPSRACEGTARCLASACVGLTSSRDASVDAGAWLVPEGEGWLTAWASYGPVFDRGLEEVAPAPGDAFAPALGRRFEALCRPGGYVDVFRRRYGKDRAPRHQLLAAHLLSDQPRRLWLKSGVAGRLRVWVGDALVLDRRSESGAAAPFRDEIATPVQVEAGVSRVLAVLTQVSQQPAGAWLRLHDEAMQVPAGVRWQPAHGRGCGLPSLLDVHASRALDEAGMRVRLSLRAAGTTPEATAVAYRLRRGRGGKAPELGSGTLTRAELTAPHPVSLAVHVPRERNETTSLVLELGGGDEPRVLSWPLVFREALHSRAASLLRRALAPHPALPQGSRDSLEHAARGVADAVAEGHADVRWLRERLEDTEALAAAAEAGQDPYADKRGVVHRAYRSELDGRLQPYTAYVPPRRRDEPLPLVVVFHGLGQSAPLALRHLIGAAPGQDDDPAWASRHLPPFPDLGAILVAPTGFGDAGQRQLGEHDVLRVIEEMKRAYAVDPARISITGYSLGGTVAFTLPLHYPSVFSAAAPLCGYPNLLDWDSIREPERTPWEESLVQRRYIGGYAENGLHLPLHIVHGGLDGPARSAVIARRYEALGNPHVFDLQKDLAHNVWDHGYENGRMVAWLARKRRPDTPRHVRLRTGELRYDRAHWVQLYGVRDPSAFAQIDAERTETGEVKVSTENVAAFALDLSGLELAAGAPVLVDGRALPAPRGMLYLEAGDDGFQARSTPPDRRGHKRAGVSGPLDDVLRHRQLIVFGTQDAAQAETNRMVAEHWSSYDTWAGARFPVVADTEVDESLLTGRSLVLIGNPASNAVTAQLASALPVAFEPGALTFRGERHEGDDVGASFIYPHPRDADEYVVVHAGVGPRGTLASRHLPRFSPDYLVYGEGITALRGGELLGARKVRAGGYFDETWR